MWGFEILLGECEKWRNDENVFIVIYNLYVLAFMDLLGIFVERENMTF